MPEFESTANQTEEHRIRSGKCGHSAPKLVSGKKGTIRQQTETCSSKYEKDKTNVSSMSIARPSDARKKCVLAL
jgi:hypothetical protein